MMDESPPTGDGGSPTSCSARMFSLGVSEPQPETQLPTLIQQRLRDLLGEPLSAADRASVRQTPLRTCVPGEIVAVEGSDGTLRYGKVQDEEGPGEVKVQVSKACIRWYALSQIYFFQAVGARKDKLGDDQPTETEKLDDRSLTLDIVAEVNALLARLNVSLSTSYEELLAEVLRLQHQAALADEDRRAAWKQVEQAMRQKTDAEKALVCVICLVKTVDRVLIPCGHSYCSACVKRLHRDSCPVCRQEITDSAAFRIS